MKEQKDNKLGIYFRCNVIENECKFFSNEYSNIYCDNMTKESVCVSRQAQTAAMISELEKKGYKVVKDD